MECSDQSRRKFLEKVLIGAGSFATMFFGVKLDSGEGVKIGGASVKLGTSEAHAACGTAFECSGGGGECGTAFNCSGGGGACGLAFECSGGGGSCGTAFNCSGS